MNIINRLNKNEFLNLLGDESRDVILVQGARQVGKTTFIQQVLSGRPFVTNLNLEKDLDFLRDLDRTLNFEEFTRLVQLKVGTTDFDSKGSVLFIDEAQESEKIGSYIRFMKEDWKNIRVILSGSSMTRIFRNVQRVPVGRFRPWLITPLTYGEFLSASPHSFLKEVYANFCSSPKQGMADNPIHNEFLKSMDEYLTVGGLPAVVTTYFSGADYIARRRFILNSQEDDFVRKSSLSDRSLFNKGMKGVANFIGMPSKKSHIHEVNSLSEKILSELAAWNLVHEVEQKGTNSTTQHLSKRYIYDCGVAQDLREMPFPRLSLVSTQSPVLRTQLGGLFENALLLQIIGERTFFDSISGWKKGTSDSQEIDFILRHETGAFPIECKATQKISSKNWSALQTYLDITNQKIGFIVSAAPFEVLRRGKHILINLPIYFATRGNIFKCAKIYST